MSDYRAFLEAKVRLDRGTGFEIPLEAVHPVLKPHQRAIVQWAVRGGRRAIFARFGLGTVPLRAVMAKRRGRGCELNHGYWQDSIWYLREAAAGAEVPTLFDMEEVAA